MATKKVPSKKAVAKVDKEPAKAAPKFSVSVTLNEQTFTTKAASIFEALTEFELPPFVKTEAVIAVKAGKQASEMVLGVFGARRTFRNQTALKILASNLEKRLG